MHIHRGVLFLSLTISSALLAYLVLYYPQFVPRLYWEYAGRLLNRPVTLGYIEWVHNRVGEAPDVGGARILAGVAAPYSDFPAEYPPGALMLFAAIRYFWDGLPEFQIAFTATMAAVAMAAMIASLMVLTKVATHKPSTTQFVAIAAFLAFFPYLASSFLVVRFDIVPALFVALGFLCIASNRTITASLLLGLGAAVKLWPVIIAPLLFIQIWTSGQKSLAILFALVFSFAFLLPHAALVALGTNPSDLLDYISYLKDRPAQVESVVANLIMVYSSIFQTDMQPNFSYGSHNVTMNGSNFWMAAFTTIQAAASTGILLITYMTQKRLHVGSHILTPNVVSIAAATTLVGVAILFSKVFSGEYMIWMFPFAIMLARSKYGSTGIALLGGSCMILKLVYDYYPLVSSATLEGGMISLAKNVLLAGAVGAFAYPLFRKDTSRDSNSVGDSILSNGETISAPK